AGCGKCLSRSFSRSFDISLAAQKIIFPKSMPSEFPSHGTTLFNLRPGAFSDLYDRGGRVVPGVASSMRVGIIGTGAIADKHAQAYRNIGHQVLLRTDRTEARGTSLRELLPEPQIRWPSFWPLSSGSLPILAKRVRPAGL